jgi:hypothetical protein
MRTTEQVIEEVRSHLEGKKVTDARVSEIGDTTIGTVYVLLLEVEKSWHAVLAVGFQAFEEADRLRVEIQRSYVGQTVVEVRTAIVRQERWLVMVFEGKKSRVCIHGVLWRIGLDTWGLMLAPFGLAGAIRIFGIGSDGGQCCTEIVFRPAATDFQAPN